MNQQSTQNEAMAATAQALLEAAAAVFAEQGYRDATVRQICKKAGANVAAVNYHFGDKERLYVEVLRYSCGKALAKFPPDYGLAADATPEKKLEAFIRSFLYRIFDGGPSAVHGRLMLMEMLNPTPALDALVQDMIRSMYDKLSEIIQKMMGETVSELAIRMHAGSVVGQCIFYLHSRPMVLRLFPEMKFEAKDIEMLAAHITVFSLAAIKAGRTIHAETVKVHTEN